MEPGIVRKGERYACAAAPLAGGALPRTTAIECSRCPVRALRNGHSRDVLITILPLAGRLQPRRATAEVVGADGAAFVGQSENEVRIEHHHSVVHTRAWSPVLRRCGGSGRFGTRW